MKPTSKQPKRQSRRSDGKRFLQRALHSPGHLRPTVINGGSEPVIFEAISELKQAGDPFAT
jgi:hypothetical protein